MAELWAAIKLFIKLYPQLRNLYSMGADKLEDMRVENGSEDIKIVFKKQKKQDEGTTIEETANNASDLDDVFRK